MAIILELLFGVFQGIACWGRWETKQSTANKYFALGVIAIVLLIIFLIWRYNPHPQITSSNII